MGNSFSGRIMAHQVAVSSNSSLHKQLDRLKLVTFCFGANDAAISQRNATWRRIPEADFKANLIAAINTFREAGVHNFLLLTPPPPVAPPRIDRRLDATGSYAYIVQQVGHKMGVPVVDVFHAILDQPEWFATALSKYGLHLAPLGQRDG